jgi:biotin synthase
VQCLDVPDLIGVLVPVVEALRSSLTIPISVAIPPLNQEALLQLAEAGVTNVGLGLDACTPEVYAQAKGSAVGGLYTWDQHIAAVEAAGGVLGTARVSVHLIIGLGETEEDAIRLMAHFFRAGYNVGLFALMPVVGTPSETLQQPPLRQFRVLQLVRHLLVTKRVDLRDLQFEGGRLRSLGSQIGGKALQDYCHTFQVFETTGCVGCNRPYYTSKPGGVTYNYPAAVPPVDLETIAQELHYLVEDIG